MKKILLSVSLVTLLFSLSSCLTISPTINNNQVFKKDKGYIGGVFSLSNSANKVETIAISFINEETNKEVLFWCNTNEDKKVQIIEVIPGKYKIYKWYVTDFLVKENIKNRNFKETDVPFPLELEVTANSIMYVGSYHSTINLLGNNMIHYGIESIKNDYNNFTVQAKSKYKKISNDTINNIFSHK